MSKQDDWEFQRVVNEGLVPKIENSAVCVSINPRDGGVDAKFAVELGVMIMLDKPILVINTDDRPIPAKLRLVADKVVDVTDLGSDAGQAAVMKAIHEMGIDP